MNRQSSTAALILAISLVLTGCATAPSAPEASDPTSDLMGPQAKLPPASAKALHVASAKEALSRGDDAWRAGSTDMALYMFVQGLKYEPKNAQLLAKIGSIHERRGNLELARSAFTMAKEADPSDARLNERLGFIYLAEGNDTAAEAALTAADQAAPDRWHVLDALGQLAQRRGAHEDALQYFKRASTLNPQSAKVLAHRGEMNFALGRLNEAESDLRAALAIEKLPDAWRTLGAVQVSLKEYEQAFASFLQVGDAANAYNEVGEAALRHMDTALALQYFEKAARASPTYFERAHKNLALATEQLRKDPMAKDRSLRQPGAAHATR